MLLNQQGILRVQIGCLQTMKLTNKYNELKPIIEPPTEEEIQVSEEAEL